jgi:predicted amidophosphoribosyltransferase
MSTGSVRRIRRLRRLALHHFLSVLLPADCFACGRPLGPVHLLGACPDCWSALRPIGTAACPSCGAPRPKGTDLLGPAGGRCAPCLLRPKKTDGVRAAVIYDAVARSFVLRAKFGGRRELLTILGRQLALVLRATGFAEPCTVVSAVPSDPWVRLRRGFNPALELARPVARHLGLPLERRALIRRLGGPAPSKRLGAARRRSATRRAFRPGYSLSGERVLLIDDVFTTGATAEGCAAALLGGGAESVRLAVWARTPLRRGAV